MEYMLPFLTRQPLHGASSRVLPFVKMLCQRVTGRKGVKSNVIYSGFFPDIPWVSTVRAHKIEGTNTHNVAIALVENRRMRRTSKQ